MSEVKEYRPRLTHAVIVKAPSLLPMWYKVSELEQALGVPARTLQDWVRHGVPHQRDATGHVWVNGRDFAAWVEQNRPRRQLLTMAGNEAYCFTCRKVVTIEDPVQHRHGTRVLLQGSCPDCGTTVNRGQRGGQ